MLTVISIASAALSLLSVALLVILLRRKPPAVDLVPVIARMEAFERAQERFERTVRDELARARETTDRRLQHMQEDNGRQLDEMRRIVDEKLQGTLDRRLGESFKIVSDRLEQVHQGLGEMQKLAVGVGDLKKVLTNVRTRGTWGEVQLAALLEQILSPTQYEANVNTTGQGLERVEFAIKLPGQGAAASDTIWLPIDAKFPLEDYLRLTDAMDAADPAQASAASAALELRIRESARDISRKYLAPPLTTDFGIMFLPTEGLYAEVLRRPELVERIRREYRVEVAGPTTLGALLNSLQMGFRTLAIQRRSSEVWSVLGSVKTEFHKFGGVLDRVRKKLQEASNVVDQATVRSRVIDRHLRDVEALPAPGATMAGLVVLPAAVEDATPQLESVIDADDREAGRRLDNMA